MEGQTQTFTIEDFDRPDAFGIIQSWMYTQNTDGWKEKLAETQSFKLYCAWILADRLIIPKLQNDVITILPKMILPLGDIHWLYKNTTPGGKLRSFMSDWCAITSKLFIEYKEGWSN